MKKYNERLTEFNKLITKIEYMKNTLNSLVYWDKLTYMPVDGIEYRSHTMRFLSDELYKMLNDEKITSHIGYFDGNENNSPITVATLKKLKGNSFFINSIPEEEYANYIEHIAISEQVWEKARQDKDFKLFKPYLEKSVEYYKSFAEHWGYEDNPYDAWMKYYGEGLSVDIVDNMSKNIKNFLVEFIPNVKERAEHKKTPIKMPKVSIDKQKAISEKILSKLGFNFNAGRVDIGTHPTTLSNSPKDVRIINSYNEADIRTGIFNILHAGGKGIYGQDISPDLMGTLLAEPSSFALEESIGRIYENIIGRSKGFWEYFYPDIIKIAPEMKAVSVEEIFRSVNEVNPSLIRIYAEELTYMQHIVIRYEIEKDLINRRITVKDLPDIWNQKYEEYLGVRPSDDGEGILQDIHWAAGYFGYFPSYFIANSAAAQFAFTIEKEVGSIEELSAKGDFKKIHDWLSLNIHQFGASLTTTQLIKRATGEEINAKYYTDYLRKKYSEVYKL